mmetsp:Transcript_6343/g.15265  ORF Transcript_6343/g.15265 Transcript_6343/m.15265 type:complete len:349 (-) Transcript_6343:10-1056(-)
MLGTALVSHGPPPENDVEILGEDHSPDPPCSQHQHAGHAPPDETGGEAIGNEGELSFPINVSKQRPSDGLGIDVTYSCSESWARNRVFVARVLDHGLICDWNESSEEPYRVRAGDSISKVNDVSDNAVSMIEEMKKKDDLAITIGRKRLPTSSSTTLPAGVLAALSQCGNSALPRSEATNATFSAKVSAQFKEEQDADAEHRVPEGVPPMVIPFSSGPAESSSRPPRPVVPSAPAVQQPQPLEAIYAELTQLSDQVVVGLLISVFNKRPHLKDAVYGAKQRQDGRTSDASRPVEQRSPPQRPPLPAQFGRSAPGGPPNTENSQARRPERGEARGRGMNGNVSAAYRWQ